jgi:hypothetical protein
MTELHNYIQSHTATMPGDTAPAGQKAVQLIFLDVVASDTADADTLRSLLRTHKGEHLEVDIFDGQEHSYIELGAWLGSQHYALALIGLGTHLGLWNLLSPRTVFPAGILSAEQEQQLAGRGLVSVQAVKQAVPEEDTKPLVF